MNIKPNNAIRKEVKKIREIKKFYGKKVSKDCHAGGREFESRRPRQ